MVSPYHLCDVMIVLNNARVNCSDHASLDSLGVNRFVLVLLQHFLMARLFNGRYSNIHL